MTGDADDMRWTLIVPVKRIPAGKTRLAARFEPGPRWALVRAMLADTLAAAAHARLVGRLVVVTGDPWVIRVGVRAATTIPVDLVGEPEPAGLNAAVRAGIDHARRVAPTHGIGVLLGDLPSLRSAELDEALAGAARHPLSFVADHAGTGTTLLLAGPGIELSPAFGVGSAQAHAVRGHVRLEVADDSGLAHDVDVPADLDAALALGVGARTRGALGAGALPDHAARARGE